MPSKIMNTLFTGLNCIELQSTDSTNNYAATLLKQTNVPEGTVILAHKQTRGRGQRGADWYSEQGKNLTLSVIYKPVFLSVAEQFMLSKIVAISLKKLISIYAEEVKIKWPNDILVKNKKIAGVLIENNISGHTIQHVILGIGININQKNFKRGLNATSLCLEKKKTFNIKVILEQFCSILEAYYIQLRNNAVKDIEENYIQNLYGLNEWMTYIFNGKTIKAMITGVSVSGKLRIITEENEKLECDIKEIKLVL